MKLTDEQRAAIEWASKSAQIASLGKALTSEEWQRYCVLRDMLLGVDVEAVEQVDIYELVSEYISYYDAAKAIGLKPYTFRIYCDIAKVIK